MEIAVIAGVVVIALFLLRFLRLSPKIASVPTAPGKAPRMAGTISTAAPSTRQPFRAVSVRCGPGACEQALALGNQRFITGRLRKLPLAGCTAVNCHCKFQHHPDRRDSQGDQRAPAALRSQLYTASGKPERRSRRGRRGGDLK
jgi:hypothetical protein